MGTGQGEIFPCHAGCIMNAVGGRSTHEVGDIDLEEMEPLLEKARVLGLENKEIVFQ